MHHTFAEALQSQLDSAGITAYRLYKLSGVSHQTISALLSGQRGASFATVVRIARALSVPLESFVTADIDLPDQSAKPRGRGRPRNES